MTTLDELLSPKRQKIDDDNVAAILTYNVVHDGQAAIRVALVRATVRLCIKELQANGEHQAVACIEKILTKTKEKP